jgi:hypothetical protein
MLQSAWRGCCRQCDKDGKRGGGDAVGHSVPVAFGDEGQASSEGGMDGSTDEEASDNENSRTYCLSASTITLGRIKEMAEKGYFLDGKA